MSGVHGTPLWFEESERRKTMVNPGQQRERGGERERGSERERERERLPTGHTLVESMLYPRHFNYITLN